MLLRVQWESIISCSASSKRHEKLNIAGRWNNVKGESLTTEIAVCDDAISLCSLCIIN
jgi:hypothetical protein